MDIDWLYLALTEKELELCIGPEMGAEWEWLRSNDCVDRITADAVAIFLPRTCCVKQKQHAKRESLASSKKSSDVRRCYVFVVRHTVTTMSSLINLNPAVKVSTNV